ncbi:MAG: hypothetical protein P1S60_04505 [Anaerolineae bacterium]|nr:hypothetical protein [Anaerolineae bacterium]
MALPEQSIRILAGTPIEVANQRLLPSVLVKTNAMTQPRRGKAWFVKLRPTSIVVTSSRDTKWLEIPNTTMDTLSTMAGAGAIIALVSLVVIVIARWLKSY